MAENWRAELRKKAEEALGNPSPYGEDIDLSRYMDVEPSSPKMSKDVESQVEKVGIDLRGASRSATFFQYDHSVLMLKMFSGIKGLEIMDTESALSTYPWLKEYYWKLVNVDADKYTATAELYSTKGYFIRVSERTKVTIPVQTCLFIGTHGILQAPHNIIIAEPYSEIHIITGCTAAPWVKDLLHLGISEFYVKRGAKVVFTMIHSWPERAYVRPRTGVVVEEEGVFISNYIILRPLKSLQTYPTAWLAGRGASAKFSSVIYASHFEEVDMGSRIILRGGAATGEILSKVVATGNAKVVTRGQLVGEAPGTKAHLECRGLVLCPSASIHSIPEILAKHPETELSHEAAIGKLQEEQLYYLMARGVPPEKAISLLVRGFLDPGLPELPPVLKAEIRKSIMMLEAAKG